jgi:hypothetical protein
MRKVLFWVGLLMFVSSMPSLAQEPKRGLPLDDFEGAIVTGPDGTIDAGSGNGSSVSVSAAKDIRHSGAQSLKIDYDAVSGGYIWVARGYGLDVKGAAAWLAEPSKVNWSNYAAFTFYMYGSDSKARMAFDIKDANGEIFRFMVTDDFKGWKQIVCPFEQFFPRGDWQPQTAQVNGKLDFPIKSFQFEPIAVSKGTLYVDDVELEALN